MATLVSFHAHPDDECIACGGVMRKAADEAPSGSSAPAKAPASRRRAY